MAISTLTGRTVTSVDAVRRHIENGGFFGPDGTAFAGTSGDRLLMSLPWSFGLTTTSISHACRLQLKEQG